jgi:hypothetical protein
MTEDAVALILGSPGTLTNQGPWSYTREWAESGITILVCFDLDNHRMVYGAMRRKTRDGWSQHPLTDGGGGYMVQMSFLEKCRFWLGFSCNAPLGHYQKTK